MASTNAPVTYLQLISQDEKQAKTENLKLKAQEAGLEVSRSLFELGSALAKKKTALAFAQKQIPYSVVAEYTLTQDIKEIEAKIEFVTEVKNTRFGDAQI